MRRLLQLAVVIAGGALILGVGIPLFRIWLGFHPIGCF